MELGSMGSSSTSSVTVALGSLRLFMRRRHYLGVTKPPEAAARALPPLPVGPSRWALPDPATLAPDGDDGGLVGIGADLAVETVVDAYRRGIFPWPHARTPLPWFSPDPRAVIPADGVHIARSLRRRL